MGTYLNDNLSTLMHIANLSIVIFNDKISIRNRQQLIAIDNN